MSKPQKEIDQTFIRVKRRWKWQRLAEQSAVVGIVASLLLVGLGAAVFRGWISEQSRCLLCLGVICGLGVIAETAVVMRVAERVPGRSRLAAALERVDRRFQDRLNTLLFIETVRAASGEHVFASRIAEQSQRLLRSRKATQPFRLTRTFGWCAGFAAVLAMTAFLGVHYSPWDKLRAASVPRGGTREPGPEFTTADVKSQDQPRPWGEVRITEPGGDLRVTKVDVVPLSIEVAANQDLKDVAWLSSVNGNPDQAHALPEPKEPRYALYQPSIYMDELQLSDWDVLTYYACARTKEPGAFVSEIYFIEVRPFREDILKLPGGEAGAPYQALNQISGLITRQQQVIRQTYQLPQPSAAPDSNREVSLKKLSGQEADLAKASQHLYAEMAGTMENQPIGVALENLAKAETSLKESSALLEADTIVAAEERERAALSALVATRKMFQQAVSEHPSDFAPQKDSPTDPLASDQGLNKMAEFRDEAKSAEEFVQRLLEQQREVEARAADDHHSNGSVAEAEQKLSHDLKDFTAQHPRPFKNARAQSEEAQRSLESAGAALDQKAVGSASAVRRATQGLETLNSAMAKQDQGRRMADSYRLKQMIEDQVRSLDALAKSDQPPTQEKAAETARVARQTLEEFKKNLEALGAENLGQPLRDATSDSSYSELNQKLDRLQNAGNDQERQRRAGEARDSLAQLGRAFDASEPGALQAARKSDSLQPDAERGFDKGVSQLENLLKQLQQGRNVSSADQEKQARDALENMQRGLEARLGENERGQALLNGFQQLVEGHGMDPEGIRKILAQLEQFSNETRPKLAGAMAAYEILNPDLGQIPAAYRDRIERYFQKLSEK